MSKPKISYKEINDEQYSSLIRKQTEEELRRVIAYYFFEGGGNRTELSAIFLNLIETYGKTWSIDDYKL